MQETLYEKMLSCIQCRTHCHDEGIEVFGTEKASKDCERIAIQAQIDLLGKQKERILKWRKETSDLYLSSDTASFLKNIKIETIDLFLLLINDEIQELENKLSEKINYIK